MRFGLMFYSNEPAIKVTKIYPKKISLKSNETVDCTIILIVSATVLVAVYPSVSVASSPIPGPSKYKIAPHYLSSASRPGCFWRVDQPEQGSRGQSWITHTHTLL